MFALAKEREERWSFAFKGKGGLDTESLGHLVK